MTLLGILGTGVSIAAGWGTGSVVSSALRKTLPDTLSNGERLIRVIGISGISATASGMVSDHISSQFEQMDELLMRIKLGKEFVKNKKQDKKLDEVLNLINDIEDHVKIMKEQNVNDEVIDNYTMERFKEVLEKLK